MFGKTWLAKFLVDGFFLEPIGTNIVSFWRRGDHKAKRWYVCSGTEEINTSLKIL